MKRLALPSLLYTLPQVVLYIFMVQSWNGRPTLYIICFFIYTLVLVGFSILRTRKDRIQTGTDYPVRVLLVSILIYVAIAIINALTLGDIARTLAELPRIISVIIVTTLFSIIPIFISMLIIRKYDRNKEPRIKDKLIDEF